MALAHAVQLQSKTIKYGLIGAIASILLSVIVWLFNIHSGIIPWLVFPMMITELLISFSYPGCFSFDPPIYCSSIITPLARGIGILLNALAYFLMGAMIGWLVTSQKSNAQKPK